MIITIETIYNLKRLTLICPKRSFWVILLIAFDDKVDLKILSHNEHVRRELRAVFAAMIYIVTMTSFVLENDVTAWILPAKTTRSSLLNLSTKIKQKNETLDSKINRESRLYLLVPFLLWKIAWSNLVRKMNPFEAGGRNFEASVLIFGYVIAQSVMSKSYYWHFSIRPLICMRDGLKDAESAPLYYDPLYWSMIRSCLCSQ